MPLETAQYINQLDSANPLGSDPIAAGDDHIRLIKAAIKATFPNIAGVVSGTHTQLSTAAANAGYHVPAGGIIMWSGAINAIPSGWALCDGTSGTPDLRNRFVVGAGQDYVVGATGGANTKTLTEANLPAHTHTITATTASAGDHTHTITDPGHRHTIGPSTEGSGGSAGFNGSFWNTSQTSLNTTGITINSAGAHTHTITATAASVGSGTPVDVRPPYYALAYIMKL